MRKPLIGIGSDVLQKEGERDRAFVYVTYVEAVKRAGAVPLLIPPQPENVSDLVDLFDGIVLAGGFDCDPRLYGQEPHSTVEPMHPARQDNDFALARLARERRIPLLGICLGMQVMNVAAGGDLVQDIDSTVTTDIQHASDPADRVRHDVTIHADTRLAAMVGAAELNVNSSHHQAVGQLGEGLQATANAPDGIIEGLEDPSHPFYIGVQWHPEDMNGDGSARVLFDALVEAASRRAAAREK